MIYLKDMFFEIIFYNSLIEKNSFFFSISEKFSINVNSYKVIKYNRKYFL